MDNSFPSHTQTFAKHTLKIFLWISPPQRLRSPVVLLMAALLACMGSSAAIAQDSPPAGTSLPDFSATLTQLSAPEFSRRQQAVQSLRSLTETTEGIRALGQAIETHPDPETVRRVIDVLEIAYRDADFRQLQAFEVSEILERAALSGRWYLAEAAREILDRLWTRRVEIAITELNRLKIPMEPRDPTLLWQAPERQSSMFGSDPTSNQHLKIYIDETWPADPKAFQLLQRLEGLAAWSQIGGGLVSLYKIDGNPLTVEQTALLKGIFGDLRIQERGRVCLGVLQQSMFETGKGVLIGRVEKGSSADQAGLKSGDMILALNGEELSDFEELVKLLRQFKVGDTITMTVIPQVVTQRRNFEVPFPPEEPPGTEREPKQPKDMQVTLRGWYEPEEPPAAENVPPEGNPERSPQ